MSKIIFEHSGKDNVYVCSKAVFIAPFDENGGSNWETSSGRKLLQKWYEENAPEQIKIRFDIDLPTAYETFPRSEFNYWDLETFHKPLPTFEHELDRIREHYVLPIRWWTRSKCERKEGAVWCASQSGGMYYEPSTLRDLGFVPILRPKDPFKPFENHVPCIIF